MNTNDRSALCQYVQFLTYTPPAIFGTALSNSIPWKQLIHGPDSYTSYLQFLADDRPHELFGVKESTYQGWILGKKPISDPAIKLIDLYIQMILNNQFDLIVIKDCIKEDFFFSIKELRQHLMDSVAEMSRRLGVTRSHYYVMEREGNINGPVLIAHLRLLNTYPYLIDIHKQVPEWLVSKSDTDTIWDNMTKSDLLRKLGGVKKISTMLEVSHQAIYGWPEKLKLSTKDQLRGAMTRLEITFRQ